MPWRRGRCAAGVDSAQGEHETRGGWLEKSGEPCRDAAGLYASDVERSAVFGGEVEGGTGVAAVERRAGFEKLEGSATGSAAQVLAVERFTQDVECGQRCFRVIGEPANEAIERGVAAGGDGIAGADQFDARCVPVGGGAELSDGSAGVEDDGLLRIKGEVGVGRVGDRRETAFDDGAQGFERGAAQGATGQRFACGFGVEHQAVDAAHEMPADGDFASGANLGGRFFVRVEVFEERRCAAVDEAAHQRLVERVGEAILDLACAAAPRLGVLQPVAAVGSVSPCADLGQAMLQVVDLAFGAVETLDLRVHPLVADAGGRLDKSFDDGLDELEVSIGAVFAEVRQGAEVPQAADVRRRAGGALHVGVGSESGERGLVECFGRAAQDHIGRRPAQRGEQAIDAGPVEVGVAPVEKVDRLEMVVDDAVDGFFLERFAVGRLAERAIVAEAAGAACDLREFIGAEEAALAAIELAARGERDVADIEVEAHADGVGGDDVVDLARLIEFDLRVAGAGAERAHDDGAAAALALQQFGDGVDLFRREGDDGRALGQLGDLDRAGIAELRETLAAFAINVEIKPFERRTHGVGAEQHGFVTAARVEDAIGEDVAAIGILRELDLIDRHEVGAFGDRHGFDGAGEIAGGLGADAFLAGDERAGLGAFLLHHAVVDLAREQAQRQTDHSGAVSKHALHGKVRLAGVGRTQHGPDTLSVIGIIAGGQLRRSRS